MEAEDAISLMQRDPRENQVSTWPATMEQLADGCATSVRLVEAETHLREEPTILPSKRAGQKL